MNLPNGFQCYIETAFAYNLINPYFFTEDGQERDATDEEEQEIERQFQECKGKFVLYGRIITQAEPQMTLSFHSSIFDPHNKSERKSAEEGFFNLIPGMMYRHAADDWMYPTGKSFTKK